MRWALPALLAACWHAGPAVHNTEFIVVKPVPALSPCERLDEVVGAPPPEQPNEWDSCDHLPAGAQYNWCLHLVWYFHSGEQRKWIDAARARCGGDQRP